MALEREVGTCTRLVSHLAVLVAQADVFFQGLQHARRGVVAVVLLARKHVRVLCEAVEPAGNLFR